MGFQLQLKKRRRLALWAILIAGFIVNTILFNNCSKGFQSTIDSTFSNQESHSEGETPPPTDPPSPVTQPPTQTPAQPPPAPIQPIVMTNSPAWMAGKSLNEWIEIPNTSGAGGAAIGAFSGLALREATSELVIGAAGGHSDSSDNRVVSLVLETDSPKWILRIPPSPLVKIDVSHYADGTPSSRHTYQNTYYIESLNRLFLFGAYGTFGNAYQFKTVDAFSFQTNQWDPPGTWAPLPQDSNLGAVKIPGTDDVFTSSLHKWSAAQATRAYQAGNPSTIEVWSSPITTRTDTPVRWPLAYDKLRNQFFSLQFGDGQGYGQQTAFASRIDLTTGVQMKITIKPSSVFDLFLHEAPTYSAMDYDPENDRFLFYSGIGVAAGRIYVIKPSAGTEWEMSLFATTASSPQPPATPGAGVNSNFKYIPRLKGFVLLPNGSSNLFFLKTAQ